MKPNVKCPHCGEHVEAKNLSNVRKYRNEYGIDVFECPECKNNFKFEPAEYLVARQGIENGEIPEGVAIDSAKENELLPSETLALNYNGPSRAPWVRLFKKIIVIALLGYLLYIFFS